MKLKKFVLCYVSLYALQGCTSLVAKDDIGTFLQSKVGTVFDIQHDKYYSTDEIDSNHVSKKLTRNDGCIYSFIVNKNTNIIESWHFVSDPSLCKPVFKTGA
jgi:hypothetical protein